MKLTEPIPAPRTRSGMRYVVQHRSGKWRGRVKYAGKLHYVSGLFDRRIDAFHAAAELRLRLRSGAESVTTSA